MRTDAKIGFAIVGVLLTVLVVYAVVIPRHKRPSQQATVVLKPTPEPADRVSGPPTNADLDPVPPVSVPPVSIPPRGETTPPKPPANGDAVARGDGTNPPANSLVPPPLIDPVLPDPPVVAKPHVPDRRDPAKRSHAKSDAGVHAPAETVLASRTYTVRAGQTLSSIANDLYGDPRAYKLIAKANPKLNPSRLKVGAQIQVPDPTAVHPHPAVVVPAADVVYADDAGDVAPVAGRTYVVKAGDSLYKIAKRVLGSGRQADTLFDLNRGTIGSSPSRLRQGMVLRLPSAAL